MAKNTDPSQSKQRKLANLKPWKEGQSGNPAGRPPGIPNLESRVQALLNGETPLPPAIATVIRNQCGEGKKAIDAVFIVGLLQALQGDKAWAQFIVERGWGKVPGRLEGGGPTQPIHHTFTLKIDNG